MTAREPFTNPRLPPKRLTRLPRESPPPFPTIYLTAGAGSRGKQTQRGWWTYSSTTLASPPERAAPRPAAPRCRAGPPTRRVLGRADTSAGSARCRRTSSSPQAAAAERSAHSAVRRASGARASAQQRAPQHAQQRLRGVGRAGAALVTGPVARRALGRAAMARAGALGGSGPRAPRLAACRGSRHIASLSALSISCAAAVLQPPRHPLHLLQQGLGAGEPTTSASLLPPSEPKSGFWERDPDSLHFRAGPAQAPAQGRLGCCGRASGRPESGRAGPCL